MPNQPTPKTVDQLYPDPWLRVDDLNGRAYVLTIKRCDIEMVHSTIARESKLVAILDIGRTKRLILNKTQCEAVADIAGSRIFDEWPGTKISVREGRATNGKATIVISRPAPTPTAVPIPTPEPEPEEPDEIEFDSIEGLY